MRIITVNNIILIISLLFFSCSITISQKDYKNMRDRMVEDQLIARGIKDERVITAMKKVERHKFVPENLQDVAYGDFPLPIGYDQTISQPYIVAYMTEILKIKSSDKVLEIGTGSGYQAAILAELCDTVYSIEIVEELAKRAKDLIEELGYKNISIKIGDGYKGWAEHAPYDAIIVTCAPSDIPEPLIEQLKEDGRMIIPVGHYTGNQYLVYLTKKNGKLSKYYDLPVRFVPMIHGKEKE